tara:strand:- start:18440 stop:19369 length:930 start_codon:yes stop_codon:yes gene_type:complete
MYNEESAIDSFFKAVRPVLNQIGLPYEIVCVNDGSRDATLAALTGIARKDARVRIIDLSRNFGKEAALTAGLDLARGRAVVPIDADLQEPPELIALMVKHWQEGYDVVLARRSGRRSDTALKRGSARLFYRFLRVMSDVDIPENVGDFRLMDRAVVDALRRLPERSRFMKGIFAWLGFRQITLDFVRPARQDGSSKFGARKLMQLATEGIVSFSTVPLRMWSYVGFAVAAGALIFMLYIIFDTIFFGRDTPGFATLATVLLFFNGLVMINLGIIGEYLARIFTEVKARPIYLVRDEIQFSEEPVEEKAT